MIERQFFIYPLSEEEIKNLNNKPTGSIATEYQQPPAIQIEPERNTATERRIFTIYEAPKTEVATQQNQTAEVIPNTLTPENTVATNERPEPAFYPELKEYFSGDPYTELKEYFSRDPYEELKTYIYGEQSPTEESQLASIRSELAELTPAAGAPAPQAGELAAAA